MFTREKSQLKEQQMTKEMDEEEMGREEEKKDGNKGWVLEVWTSKTFYNPANIFLFVWYL